MAQEEVEPKFAEINKITDGWSQGDCWLGSCEFVFVPTTDHHIASEYELEEDDDVFIQEVDGLCVISQTCDIVRCCKSRPYIEVSPLVAVEEERLEEVENGGRPNYGFLPLLKDKKLVVDFDRVMTLEKSFLKNVERVPGCNDDNERRSFAKALARKRVRFAFPTDFNGLVSKLRSRIKDKHGKESDEGEALRSLYEIRVAASPSWDEEEVDLFFYFIRKEEQPTFKGTDWDELCKKWMSYLKETGRY
ncbi:MAG: hypothetical protein KDD35_11910, partial [Bdellovibrionales bacterium]|nr:hypothetical protein [Bdellovibrionales bacterium]